MRALTIILIMLAGSAAWAQAGPSAQDKKNAEKYFNEATKAYNEGRYAEAVPGYIAAYQLVPDSAILFTIGQTYRLSGDKEKAISYYEKYVEFAPKGPAVEEAKQHISELKTAIEADKQKQQAEAQKQADDQAHARAAAEQKRRADELVRARAAAREEGHGMRVAGVVVGAAGIVGLGVGIALAASDGKISSGAAIAGGAGVACLVAGGVMYYLGAKKAGDAEAALPKSALLPVVGPQGAGVVFVTTF